MVAVNNIGLNTMIRNFLQTFDKTELSLHIFVTTIINITRKDEKIDVFCQTKFSDMIPGGIGRFGKRLCCVVVHAGNALHGAAKVEICCMYERESSAKSRLNLV